MRWVWILGILYLSTATLGDEPTIVIIGAGAAGIAASSKLYENGFKNVTILEAENRFGGRIYTTWFHESWLDLGGQWVHGQTNNIAFELAWPLGLLEVPPETPAPQARIFNSKGVMQPVPVTEEIAELYERTYHGNFTGQNGSVGDYFRRTVSTEIKKYPNLNGIDLEPVMKLLDSFTMAEDGSDTWEEVSVKGYLETWACPGDNEVNWKDRGYGTILDILTKKIPNPEEELPVLNNTLLNSEVVNVDYHSIKGKVLVKTSNGKQYIADHVIVTPSLGVLKAEYRTLFTPQLPEYKVKTIKGLAFGTVGKIYLHFDTPWWPQDSAAHYYSFMWDDFDRREYERDPHRRWMLDVMGVFTLRHRPKIMYSWVGGAGARYMETLSEDEISYEIFGLMKKFLGRSYYNLTTPTGLLRTTWYSNKHFRGTYSFRSMETERADVWADQLAAPLLVNGIPIVMFAGEATHAHYYSNVHGAIESGFREADRLIDMYPHTSESTNFDVKGFIVWLMVGLFVFCVLVFVIYFVIRKYK